MAEQLPFCARQLAAHNKRWEFGTHCHEVRKLLRQHPHGMTLPNVQQAAQLSVKTAKSVLALVALEKDGRFYAKA